MSSDSKGSDPQNGRLNLLKGSEIDQICDIVDGNLAVAAYDDWRNGNACTRKEMSAIVQELIDAEADNLATAVIESDRR